MPAKRKASSTDLQEPRRPRGRPPKPDKAKAKAPLAKAKAPFKSKAKAPPSKPKTPSASTSASDNSGVLTLSTESSRRSLSPLTDSDVQDATEALLGLAGGLAGQRSTNNMTNDVSDGEDDGPAKRVEEDEDEEDDLDTDNDEETPEEEPITSVELLVPVDGASDPWELEFSMDWDDFLDTMEDKTGIRVRDLKLGYKPSTAGSKESMACRNCQFVEGKQRVHAHNGPAKVYRDGLAFGHDRVGLSGRGRKRINNAIILNDGMDSTRSRGLKSCRMRLKFCRGVGRFLRVKSHGWGVPTKQDVGISLRFRCHKMRLVKRANRTRANLYANCNLGGGADANLSAEVDNSTRETSTNQHPTTLRAQAARLVLCPSSAASLAPPMLLSNPVLNAPQARQRRQRILYVDAHHIIARAAQ
ncbi:hypothetical protein B0H12DRAFT_1312897 [Mycena haematopus]|nr:hypothetical protein B0H12DRAFT_1312897 [Mycena haematopus]